MKRYYTLLFGMVLVVLSIDLPAQDRGNYPYIFAQPDSMGVRWIYYPQDTTAINDTIRRTFPIPGGGKITYFQFLDDGRDYIFYSRGLLDRDTLYVMYQTGYFTGFSNGTFLEKLNVNTGESYWTQRYDGRTMEHSETPNYIYKRNNHELVILGFRGDSYGSRYCRFYKRIYDTRTGQLLSHTYGDKDSSNTPLLLSTGTFNWSHLYPQSDTTSVYYSVEHGDYRRDNFQFVGDQMRRYVLDDEGHKRDSISLTINQPARYYFQYIVDLMPLDKDRIIAFREGRNALQLYGDTLRREFYLEFLTKDLHSLKTVDISAAFDSAFYRSYSRLYRVTPDHIMIYIQREKKLFTSQDRLIAIYDHEGTLLDRIVIDTVPGTGGRYPYLLDAAGVFDKSADEVYISSTVFLEKERRFELVLMTKKFGEEPIVIGRWRVNKQDAAFLPQEFIPLEGGDILIRSKYNLYRLDPKSHRYYWDQGQDVWFRVNGLEISANSDLFTPVLDPGYTVKLYPNPTGEDAYAIFDHPFSGSIMVIDQEGRVIHRSKISKKDVLPLSVRGWGSGTYFLKAVEDNGRVYRGTIVVQ